MPGESQVDAFIRALSELRDEERESQKARLRLQLAKYDRRFPNEIRTGNEDADDDSELNQRPIQAPIACRTIGLE